MRREWAVFMLAATSCYIISFGSCCLAAARCSSAVVCRAVHVQGVEECAVVYLLFSKLGNSMLLLLLT